MQRSIRRKRPAASSRADLARIPAVSRLLDSRALVPAVRAWGAPLITDLVRDELARLRAAVLDGKLDGAELRAATSGRSIAEAVERAARELLAPRPRPVINATGVVVHTNLGRSLLSEEAARHVAASACDYVDLEYDVADGKRGSRLAHLEPLMERLFPGRGFLVVNNNAAAIMLCLRALAAGKEVVVSRGELVEIGGSFRVPDILAASGARLREVGTTNRTRLADYRAALSGKTGAILKVHTSNFRIVGFTEGATIASLAGLARKHGLPLVVDWGSGDLVDLGPLGIRDEQPVAAILEAGADLVTFSGDKLLGGPQAGFVVGDRERVAKLRADPLARVCRLDRLLIAALQRTLAAYVAGKAFEEVPTLRMLAVKKTEIGRRAGELRKEVARRTKQAKLLGVVDGVSRTGGGSSPAGERPTRLLAIDWPTGDAAPLERRLREGDPPVIARIRDGRLLIDLRTVRPDEDGRLADVLCRAIRSLLANGPG